MAVFLLPVVKSLKALRINMDVLRTLVTLSGEAKHTAIEKPIERPRRLSRIYMPVEAGDYSKMELPHAKKHTYRTLLNTTGSK